MIIDTAELKLYNFTNKELQQILLSIKIITLKRIEHEIKYKNKRPVLIQNRTKPKRRGD